MISAMKSSLLWKRWGTCSARGGFKNLWTDWHYIYWAFFI